jgi:GIY-YIG catalytic domain
MNLHTIIGTTGIAREDIAVMLHVSDRPRLHRALPILASEHPDLFNAFQNQHGPKVEATLMKRGHIASFVNLRGDEYAFVGLFKVTDRVFQSMQDLDADPYRTELRERYGDVSFVELGAKTGLNGRIVFSLSPRTELEDLRGRLLVRKNQAPRQYRFLAENIDAPIIEISRESQLVPPPPDWREFVVAAGDLATLPKSWQVRLSGWRGVYLITDEKDGARYVGAAYGAENLLGRWRAHVAREKGVTVELGQRDTSSFRFSILQLLLHDANATDVQAIEANWKGRLHTRIWGLNKN